MVDYQRSHSPQRVYAEEQPADTSDMRFLVSALLIFVAKGDGNISDLESGRMIELLATRMKVSNAVALASLSMVLNALQDNADIARKLRGISDQLSARQKRDIFTMMLDVAAVDDVREDGETEAIEIASRILDMTPDEIEIARRDFFGDY